MLLMTTTTTTTATRTTRLAKVVQGKAQVLSTCIEPQEPMNMRCRITIEQIRRLVGLRLNLSGWTRSDRTTGRQSGKYLDNIKVGVTC